MVFHLKHKNYKSPKKSHNILELLSNALAVSCRSAKPSIYYSTNHKQHEQLIHRFNGIWYSVPGNSAAGAALFVFRWVTQNIKKSAPEPLGSLVSKNGFGAETESKPDTASWQYHF